MSSDPRYAPVKDMNGDKSEPTPPPLAQPVISSYSTPPKKSRWKLWLGLGIGGFVVVAIACAGGFGWLILGGKAEVEPVAAAFLDRLETKDFDGAYQATGPKLQATVAREDFVRVEKVIHMFMGSLRSKSLQSFDIHRATGDSEAEITYSAVFANGAATIDLTVTQSAGTWKVTGHVVRSPVIDNALKCPKCGAVQKNVDYYCSSCGAKMPYAD